MISVGYTGTRFGMTDAQGHRLLLLLLEIAPPPDEFQAHHGDCVGGDAQFDAMVRELPRAEVWVHPGPAGDRAHQAGCDGPRHRRLAPRPHMKRNRDLVEESAVLIAAPFEDQEGPGGTWSTVRIARSRGKPVAICYPDCSVSLERWPGGFQ